MAVKRIAKPVNMKREFGFVELNKGLSLALVGNGEVRVRSFGEDSHFRILSKLPEPHACFEVETFSLVDDGGPYSGYISVYGRYGSSDKDNVFHAEGPNDRLVFNPDTTSWSVSGPVCGKITDTFLEYEKKMNARAKVVADYNRRFGPLELSERIFDGSERFFSKKTGRLVTSVTFITAIAAVDPDDSSFRLRKLGARFSGGFGNAGEFVDFVRSNRFDTEALREKGVRACSYEDSFKSPNVRENRNHLFFVLEQVSKADIIRARKAVQEKKIGAIRKSL